MKQLCSLVVFILSYATPSFAEYDRKACEQHIKPDSFVVAGSFDDESTGGKTYSFERIVSAIQSEVHGNNFDKKRFDCLADLHAKAVADSSDYWKGRLARSACADASGAVPNVRPEGCDEETYQNFKENFGHIAWASSRLSELSNECSSSSGQNSCGPSELEAFANTARGLISAGQDSCCEIKKGSAFKVLRGFYTFEFGKLSDADLQKECYKRTRANTKGVLATGAYGLGYCMKGALFGVFESLMKMGSTIKSLFSMGTLSEIWKLVSAAATLDFGVLKAKLIQLFSAIYEQVTAQIGAASCFTGEYAADHACKLVSSLVTDWFVGAKALQGLKILAVAIKTPGGMGLLAKQMIQGAPRLAADIKKSITSIPAKAKSYTGAAKNTGLAIAGVARAAAASRLSALAKVGFDFGKKLQSGIVELRTKMGIVVGGKQNVVAIRGSVTATGAAAEVVPAASASGAASAASTTAKAVRMTANTADKIIEDLKPFNIKRARTANPEKAFLSEDTLKSKNWAKSSPAEKLATVEKAAAARRDQVERLMRSNHSSKMTQAQAQKILANIDENLAFAKGKFGPPNPAGAAVAGTTAAGSAAPGAVTAGGTEAAVALSAGADAAAAKGTIDTAIPQASGAARAGAHATGPETIISAPARSTAQALEKVPEWSPYDAVQPNRTWANPAIENTWKDLSSFMQKTQGVGDGNFRNAVFGTKGPRGITKESIFRHRQVEDMFRKGVIDADAANSMHNIIATSEKLANGSAFAYPTSYIVSPNASPGTFSNITVSKKAKAALVMTAGPTMTNKQMNEYSDERTNGRYSPETIRDSNAVYSRLTNSRAAVGAEFESLKTEQEILDKADELRIKIKTVELTSGISLDEAKKAEIAALLEQIRVQRNLALAKLTKSESPKIDSGVETSVEQSGQTASPPETVPKVEKSKANSAQPKPKVKAAPPAPEAAVPPARAEGAAEAAEPAGPPEETPIGSRR